MKKLYHIGLEPNLRFRYAILPGDPARVPEIAQFFAEPQFLANQREYHSYTAKIAGERILIMSTGMGGPSTAIALEELNLLKLENVIRLGTCGGMALQVKPEDLVIATGAIRMDGCSREYVPLEFPALANFDLSLALRKAALDLNYQHHLGVVHCKDSFYGQHEPSRMPIGYELLAKWEAYNKAGCLASEMESATLFIVAQVLGMRAACILTTVWNQERAKAGLIDQECHDNTRAILACKKALESLIKEEDNAQ